MDLFVNAEKILLSKSDIDYKKADKENMLENFTLKNLETKNDLLNRNVATKSIIFAPFNSSIKEFDDDTYEFDLPFDNNLMKFIGKVKEANYQYELNNNSEIDNYQIKKVNSKEFKDKPANKSSQVATPGDIMSNPISPPDYSNKISSINTPRSESLSNKRAKGSNLLLATPTLVIGKINILIY